MADISASKIREDPIPNSLSSVEYVAFHYPSAAEIDEPLVNLLRFSRLLDMADEMDNSRPQSRLGESWDDIRSEQSRDDDLQSENSAAISIIRKNQEEDVDSLDERDSTSDMDDHESEGLLAASQELPPYHDIEPGGSHDSAMTAKPTYGRTITLQPHSSEGETINLKQNMHIFDKNESAAILRSMGRNTEASPLFGAMTMTISTGSLDLQRPFRLIYVGNSPERANVLAKFGDVVMAGKNSVPAPNWMDESRYQVIPTSFDPNAPTELVPIQAQIVVDECTTAASTRTDQGSHEKLYLRFKRGKGTLFTSTWTGKDYDLSPATSWSVPDVAVLYYSTHDDAVMRERLRITSEFMKRHQVPTIVLSEEPAWGSTLPFPLKGAGSLQFCVESPNGIVQQLPIDLETFENLDSEQLNRHIAYIWRTRKSSSQTEERELKIGEASVTQHPKTLKDVEKNLTKSLYQKDLRIGSLLEQRALQISGALILTLITSMLAYTLFRVLSPGSTFELVPSMVPSLPAQVSATVTTSLSSPLSEASAQSSTRSAVAVHNKVETSLSKVNNDIGLVQTPHREILDRTEQLAKFDVKVLGDAHVILKPDISLLSKKGRIPSFRVDVRRGEQSLDIVAKKLFDHVYTIRLSGDDAFGKLKVVIKIGNAAHEETHEIDFGRPWLKMKNWKRSAHQVGRDLVYIFPLFDMDLFGMFGGLLSDGTIHGSASHAAREARALQSKARGALQTTTNLWQTTWTQMVNNSSERTKKISQQLNKELDNAVHRLAVTAKDLGHDVAADAWQFASNTFTRATSIIPSGGIVSNESLDMAQKRAKYIMKKASFSSSIKASAETANNRRGEGYRRGVTGKDMKNSRTGVR